MSSETKTETKPRRDPLVVTGKLETLWFDAQGFGPDVVEARVVAFIYDTPGPDCHVGLEVMEMGGLSMTIEDARKLAAALTEAAGRAERGA